MATGGSGQGVNTCTICLGDYRDPRFLPCHHTFCASCVQDLADHHLGGMFPCPTCRKRTSLSSGGVASLPKNWYIQRQSSHQNMCKIHNDEKLRFHCVKCDQALCINCKLTSHEGHKTEDLDAAISKKQTKLKTDKKRLQRAMSDVTKNMRSMQRERQVLEKQKAALEKNIHNRHATIVAAADRNRDESLKSLLSVHTDLDSGIVRDIEQQKGHKAELSSLLQQLDNALTSSSATDVINVDIEMRRGRGSQTAVGGMTSPVDKPYQKPVLRCVVNTDKVTKEIENYIGKVIQKEMKERVDKAKVTECFQSAQDTDVHVFSLCHEDKDRPRVQVSYEQCGMKQNAPAKAFTETGECVGTDDKVGKLTYKPYAKDKVIRPTLQSGRFRTFCKSPTAAGFSLNNNLSGQTNIQRTAVASTDPLKSETKTEFTIQVGPHRAFDAFEVDNTEKYLLWQRNPNSPHSGAVSICTNGLRRMQSARTPTRQKSAALRCLLLHTERGESTSGDRRGN